MILRGSTTDTACGTARTNRVRALGRGRAAVRVRGWTGRAATSRATASELPPFVTAGTHRTRVSEMRDVAPRRGGPSLAEVLAAPAAHPSLAERSALGPNRHREPRGRG